MDCSSSISDKHEFPHKMLGSDMLSVSISFVWDLNVNVSSSQCLGFSPLGSLLRPPFPKDNCVNYINGVYLTPYSLPKSNSTEHIQLPHLQSSISSQQTDRTINSADLPTQPLTPTISLNSSLNNLHSLDSLSCFYTNATSLNTSKLNELIALTTSKFFHIIFITETWFTQSSNTSLPNYQIFRQYRASHGGGVAVYTRSDLKTKQVNELYSQHSEQLWLELTLPNESLLLGCVYRPPISTRYHDGDSLEQTESEINMNLIKAKKLVDSKKFNGLLIAGDFNHPNISWGPDNYVELHGSSNSPASRFLDTLQDLTLIQHVTFPTFMQANATCKNILDYVITDSPESISNIINTAPLGCTDQGHLILNWDYNLSNPLNLPKHSSIKFNYKKGDYSNFMTHTDWHSKFEDKDVNQCYDIFTSEYNQACVKFIPAIKTHANRKFIAPWMNNEILDQIKLKKRLYFKNAASKWSNADLSYAYKSTRRLVKTMIKKRVTDF